MTDVTHQQQLAVDIRDHNAQNVSVSVLIVNV